ncbi:ABC transporter substrate-binding protein [Thiomicrorhabdus heinhorstiae]|uniref:ABC transporter substrate-binding protein n=1 Tax=Thiomicrorhabdus heinhorstiae TaxID=2748010 RepID=A0ABS0BUC0_9GAMM|nr:ABC transporter substrate-binding protein [Thiomicrorhabdus heinhorstiae]MBF6056919.1 ABC transporter substrate-binding protein [Thiomicrorhabdus heinhorstiae]
MSLRSYLIAFCVLLSLIPVTASAGFFGIWNIPYDSSEMESKTLFSSFSSPPKHLDPVISYNSNEWSIISQIYEPPLQYHYLKRPYTLEPLTLQKMPEVRYLNADLQEVGAEDPQVAYSEYNFELKHAIRFQPHPAFALLKNGHFRYLDLTAEQLHGIDSPSDFTYQSTRELIADDYIYAIKRMALRQNHSPILDAMKQYIVGLDEFSEKMTAAYSQLLKQNSSSKDTTFFDLRDKSIKGIQAIDKYRYKILVKGVYPQFLYWLSMNFFAPIPWEAVRFYKQRPLLEKNLTLDTYPVGTGAFYLAENNPNRRMRLLRNSNFSHETYPNDGLAENADPALLSDAGKPLPFLDEVVYSLEKESVPLWNKFLQGYYDASGVGSDSFDQAVSVSSSGSMSLTTAMKEKGIQFLNEVEPTIFYFGFNMADPVVGGYDEKHRKLRQAVSIAINFEEYISIFLNGRGLAAQSPIPPGIFGHQNGEAGVNPYVYEWQQGRPQRKSIDEAKRLLAEAGYPDGKDSDGSSLKLYYDTAATGPDSKALLNWYRKQFAKLGIELVIRATDYNRFQDKVRGAKVQMFSWGWNADYPDPENFLFLLYGGNAAINTNGSGINSSNYDNPEFDRLFLRMKTLQNGPERLEIIEQMLEMLRKDAPWAWGFSPKSLALYHAWLQNMWANPLANNTLKYKNVDVQQRLNALQQWNQPVVWPLILAVILLILLVVPVRHAYKRRQNQTLSVNDKGVN